MLKAIIFDMDGVIIDSEALHTEAARKTLARYHVDPPAEYFYPFVGTTVEFTYESMKNDFQIPDSLEDLIEFDKENLKIVYEEYGMIPVPHVIPFIQSLHRDGLRMVIASSSSRERIQEVVENFGLSDCFEAFISGAELPRSKPAPDIFLKALEILSLKAKEALVIEDSKNGALAAKAANIACLGYFNPNSGNQDLSSANVVAESFASLDSAYLNEVSLRANKQPIIIAETDRLVLKELTGKDARALLAISGKLPNQEITNPSGNEENVAPPSVSKNLKIAAELEITAEAERLDAYYETIYSFYGYGLWGIFKKDTMELIGQCGLQHQTVDGTGQIELSYMLGDEYQGKGYALEACQSVLSIAHSRFEIEQVVALIATDNFSSVRLAEKLGMTREKALPHQNQSCYLYSLDLRQINALKARARVTDQYRLHPDTRVYGKRFSHKSKES